METVNRRQRELEILRGYCHAFIDTASRKGLWKIIDQMNEMGKDSEGHFELLRNMTVALIEVLPEAKLVQLGLTIADEKKKLEEDYRKLEEAGIPPPI